MNASDLLPCGFALLAIQFQRRRAGQPPLRAVHDGGQHLQIAQQFGSGLGRGFLLRLPPRFEKQLRRIQDAFANRGRPLAPSAIQLAGFPRIAVMFGEDRRHALAVFQVLAGHRHQKPQRHLRKIWPSRTCCWMASGRTSTSASRRDTQLTLRSNRRANSSRL